jgi:hypothetical protein
MLEIDDSVCVCGNCKNKISVQWEVDMVSSTERQMGADCLYEGEIYEICPVCGNEITAKITFSEYPVGALDYGPEIDIEDSMGTGQSYLIDRPGVYFFDL